MKTAITPRSAWSQTILHILSALAILGAGLLSACGGGGGGSSMSSTSSSTTQSCSGCGGALVTLTDAPGDFVSYIVTVDSLQLTNANGTTVQILPNTTQVDFAQLVDLSEIVSAAEIPAGKYVSASMTVDYAGATIVVDNGTASVPITNLVNGANLDAAREPESDADHLDADAGSGEAVHRHGGGGGESRARFQSLGIQCHHAVADRADDGHRKSGVDREPRARHDAPDARARRLRERQHDGERLHHPSASVRRSVGKRRPDHVATGATTTYAINGTSYTGSAGLAQLATVSAGTPVAAYGSWDMTTQTFTANNVLVGSSVAGGKLDSVEGTVLSRTG
jgi:hypothetical protein